MDHQEETFSEFLGARIKEYLAQRGRQFNRTNLALISGVNRSTLWEITSEADRIAAERRDGEREPEKDTLPRSATVNVILQALRLAPEQEARVWELRRKAVLAAEERRIRTTEQREVVRKPTKDLDDRKSEPLTPFSPVVEQRFRSIQQGRQQDHPTIPQRPSSEEEWWKS